MTDDEERKLTARVAAQGFLLRFLLRYVLHEMDEDDRQVVATSLRAALARTDQFDGVAIGDDHRAERLADTVIQTQQKIEEMLQEALDACRQAESGK